jgi:hypothetical protein
MMTPRSVRALARFYYRQRVVGFTAPERPCLDDETAARFTALLAKSNFYLEFGAGGSTVQANERGIEGISVECDPWFAEAVRKRLGATSRITVLHADIGLTREWGRPALRTLTPARRAKWRAVCETPFARIAASGKFPDFVLVDGRFRRACALETCRQARAAHAHTTLMIDDYYDPNRAHYLGVEAFLGTPERVGRSAVFTIEPTSTLPVPDEATMAEAATDFT